MKYSVKEIIDIALGIEDIGYDFYKKCHDKFDDVDIKNIFSFLAEEELRHKEIFEDLLKKVNLANEGYFSEEYYLYLKSIGNEFVFQNSDDIDKALKDIDTLNGVLTLAIQAEKDSILWYSELQKHYTENKEATAVLTNLMNEEKKHIITLVDLRTKFA